MDGWRKREGVEMEAGKKCEEANGQLVLPLASFIPCHSQFQFHLLELLLRGRRHCEGVDGWRI